LKVRYEDKFLVPVFSQSFPQVRIGIFLRQVIITLQKIAERLLGIHKPYRDLWKVVPLVFEHEPAKRRRCGINFLNFELKP
jgi:hypothetical protein